MTLRAKLLSKFASWALSKNPAGGYAGEDDERWAYTIVGDDGSPYLTRILLTRTFALAWLKKLTGLGVYLHHFHRPDGDQEMHDHPWKIGASLILNGAYVEERVDQIVTREIETCPAQIERTVLTDKKLVRFWNYLTGDDFHAVRALRGDVWTLFFTRGRFQDWGFLVDGVKVPWREYLLLNPAKGDALDKIGKAFGVERKAEITIGDFKTTDYCAKCGDSPESGSHLPHGHGYVPPIGCWNWVEPDDDYRERIRAAMRAQAQKELK